MLLFQYKYLNFSRLIIILILLFNSAAAIENFGIAENKEATEESIEVEEEVIISEKRNVVQKRRAIVHLIVSEKDTPHYKLSKPSSVIIKKNSRVLLHRSLLI